MLKVCQFVFLLSIAGCVGAPPPAQTYNPASDPMRQEAKEIIDAQMACFKREAMAKSLAKIDLDTAALAVQARCVLETQRFKAFSAAHTIENVPTFEARMRRTEADDLQTIKQMLALIRTTPDASKTQR